MVNCCFVFLVNSKPPCFLKSEQKFYSLIFIKILANSLLFIYFSFAPLDSLSQPLSIVQDFAFSCNIMLYKVIIYLYIWIHC